MNDYVLRAYSVPGTGAIEMISQDNKYKALVPRTAHSRPSAYARSLRRPGGLPQARVARLSSATPAQGLEGRRCPTTTFPLQVDFL